MTRSSLVLFQQPSLLTVSAAAGGVVPAKNLSTVNIAYVELW
jgi:hypothetical protein